MALFWFQDPDEVDTDMSLEEFLALPLTHWTSLHEHVQDIANHTPIQHHDHEAIRLVLKGKTKFWT